LIERSIVGINISHSVVEMPAVGIINSAEVEDGGLDNADTAHFEKRNMQIRSAVSAHMCIPAFPDKSMEPPIPRSAR
jgi:hypothetical protein